MIATKQKNNFGENVCRVEIFIFLQKMKRGTIPTTDSIQQWKKQQLEEEERKKKLTMEETVDSAREYITKNIGTQLFWSKTAFGIPTLENSAARRYLLKEFAALGYQVMLDFEGKVVVPEFVFDWEDLFTATHREDWFKVTLPEFE